MIGNIAWSIRIEISWKDQSLSWNSSDYDGVDAISMDPKDIWLQHLVFGNEKSQMYMLYPERIGRALIWNEEL